LIRKGFAFSIILLLLVSVVPFINGESNACNREDSISVQENEFHYMNDWSVHLTNQSNDVERSKPVYNNEESSNDVNIRSSTISGPMDSAWPMFGHDVVHSCRSPYNTENNSGAEIWRVRGDSAGGMETSAIIDEDNIVYFGTMGGDSALYALYPNGTRKWKFSANGLIWGTPALADNGDIYCTTWGGYGYFQAITKNGTERWRFYQEDSSTSSVTVGKDGTIYFGTNGKILFAVNQNGTEKWQYTTGYIIMGSPAISQDDTIYIGSGDYYLYAFYPNGTLRWRFATGGYIKGSASIAPDGTIYVPSFDGYFYALYPNGTMKWRASTGNSVAAAGVALAEDGTIYVGSELLRAYYPNGTLRWSADVQGDIYGSIPAISSDGTIYLSAGLSLVAVNPDGTVQWRTTLSNEQVRSSPSIGNDGRVYVGSTFSDYGYLHAFGLGPLCAEAYGPYNSAMTEPIQFNGEAFGGTPPYTYHWDFGDGTSSEEQNPTHTYSNVATYTAIFTVTDNEGNTSTDTAQVTITAPKPTVAIIKPVNGIYFRDVSILPFSKPFIIGKITIEVDASQEPFGIERVDFFIDDTLKATDTTTPYSCIWDTPAFFIHTIKVIAYDTSGNSANDKITVKKFF
jgi:outer membrane protein assembly factor BamB